MWLRLLKFACKYNSITRLIGAGIVLNLLGELFFEQAWALGAVRFALACLTGIAFLYTGVIQYVLAHYRYYFDFQQNPFLVRRVQRLIFYVGYIIAMGVAINWREEISNNVILCNGLCLLMLASLTFYDGFRPVIPKELSINEDEVFHLIRLSKILFLELKNLPESDEIQDG